MNQESEPMNDREERRQYSTLVWNYVQAETVGLMILVGNRLGLFKAMAGMGVFTAAQLAEKTGLSERWLLEWLRLQTAAKLVQYRDEEHFELPEAATPLLADEESGSFAAGNFTGGTSPRVIDELLESFRTGIGHSYEEAGPEGARRGESRHWHAARHDVIPRMIPALDGVADKLTQGSLVADVGCGDGALLLTMAKGYPKSEFHGFDLSRHAVDRVNEVAREMGLDNVKTFTAGGEELPGSANYDLITTFDCIHDMTRPGEVIAAIHKSLKPDGTWFIKDIRSKPRFEDNLRNPMLAMMYGFSLMACMSSALSEPGGAGLGTLGFNPEVAEKMSRDAGFTRFTMHDFKDPGNLYYEVRP